MIFESNDRKPISTTRFAPVALACAALLLGGATVLADTDSLDIDTAAVEKRGSRYTVTITNLTYDQIISPPVVVAHDGRFQLFQAGYPASDELAALAEDGMTGPLAGLIEVSDGVTDYAVATEGIPPGGSVTVQIRTRGKAKMFSLAGMLVSTNDAFVGLAGFMPDKKASDPIAVVVPAYDSGSEANTESCAHIPGPPCGSPGERVTDGAEGFVHVHRGVQGVGDLDASMKDWRNPVARVTFTRN